MNITGIYGIISMTQCTLSSQSKTNKTVYVLYVPKMTKTVALNEARDSTNPKLSKVTEYRSVMEHSLNLCI